MRLVWITTTLAAALSSVADAALRSAPNASPTPARVVPVTEETAAPGVSDNYYEPCIYLDLTAWSNSIAAESDECAIKTSYVWNGLYLPTAAERRELCSCTLLINKLQTVLVPRCSLVRDGGTISYAKLIEYAFGLCSVDGQSTPSSPSSPSSPSTNDNDGDDDDDETTTTKSKSKAPLIGGIAGGVAVIIIAIIAFFCCRKRKQASEEKSEETTQAHGAVEAMPLSPLGDENATGYSVVPKTPPTDPRSSEYVKSGGSKSHSSQRSTMSVGTYGTRVAQSETGMWDDPVLTAVRIPYDSIFFGALISRGGYGEVYKGTYKGETVAIKQLLPDRRKDLVQIDAFMTEVKLLSTLEHERIVKFIGIAWNSLSDVCAVVEYMPNGDLRSTLNTWEYEHARPHGFDADKAKIALHIAHALTYLHSCQPVIVHRDLKSKNILLNEAYDAKLTDFGVSRERGDSTMTAGVGTSLWMAPEVMMGQRYDEKADVFSFGIVLAELDTHELPYSHALDSVTGRKIVDSAILQMVSLGRLTIQFSKQAHEEIAQLGKECVALDPK